MQRVSEEDKRRFWQLVFEDHLFFIYDALGKSEVALAQEIKSALQSYTGSRQQMESILELKRIVLKGILQKDLDIKLDATFVNHMINEAEAALSPKSDHPLEYHKLWLLDAKGHEITLKKMLDPVEKEVMKLLKKGSKKFEALFTKTLEFIGYLRSGLENFPALQALTDESVAETNIYFELLAIIYDGIETGETLGMVKPIMIDHMLREQSFYLAQLGVQSRLAVDFTTRGVDLVL